MSENNLDSDSLRCHAAGTLDSCARAYAEAVAEQPPQSDIMERPHAELYG
jgi:hypothetical protein